MIDLFAAMELDANPIELPVFRHGVASGDPRQDRAVIWTRITSSEHQFISVRWHVATDAELRCIIACGDITTSAADDFTIKVDIGALNANTHYYYQFEALGQLSIIGRTKTLPNGDNHQIRFAQVACAKLNAGYFNAYARIADRTDLDFFLHLGDYIYESAETSQTKHCSGPTIGRAYDPPNECKSLDDYRRRYAQYRLDTDLQRLHQALPMIATLDDHEIADGAWRDGSGDHQPMSDGPWANRRRAALQARWEWLPLRRPNPDDLEQVFQSINMGDLLDLIVLDTRTYRDPPDDGQAIHDPERTALGLRQRQWLLREIDSSRARWRIIASPTLISEICTNSLPPSCKHALQKLKLISLQNDGPDTDPWAGYPYERDLVLRHIQDSRISNVVVLSGDVHVSIASELLGGRSERDNSPVAVEFVTPSITSQNLDDKMGWVPRTDSLSIEHALKESLPCLRWCELDSHGYVIVDVSRDRLLAEWWFVDAINRVSVNETCGAAWQVETGRPRLTAVDR